MEQDLGQIRDNLKDIRNEADFDAQGEISEGIKRRSLENIPAQGQQEPKEREKRQNQAPESFAQYKKIPKKMAKDFVYILALVIIIGIVIKLKEGSANQCQKVFDEPKFREELGKSLASYIADQATQKELDERKLREENKNLQAKIEKLEGILTSYIANQTTQKESDELKIREENKNLQAEVEELGRNLTSYIDNQNHKKLAELKSTEATVQKLQAQVGELEKNLASNLTNQMSVARNLQMEIASLRTNVMNYEEKQQQLEKLQKDTQRELMRVGHQESGQMSQRWRVAPNPLGFGMERRCMRQAMKFERPFSKEPKFIVSFTTIDSEKSKNLRLEAFAENITVDGFVFVCCTWAESIVHGFTATWTAYEN